MNKKLICMALFGSLFAKSLASKRFLQAPEEVSEDLINSVIDSLPNVATSISLDLWLSEEASFEVNEELTNLFENAENGEDFGFGEAMGEDMIYSIEAEQDFSLLNKIARLEKFAVPALAIASIAGGPTTAGSLGAILAVGELVNIASELAGDSTGTTVDSALLASTVGNIANQAIGVPESTGASLINNLGANAVGSLVKDLLNSGKQENDTINALGELINTSENQEMISQLGNSIQGLNNDSGVTAGALISTANAILENSGSNSLIGSLGEAVGNVVEDAGDVVENVFDEVKEKAEDFDEKVDEVADKLRDKMKKAAGKIGKIFCSDCN